MKKRLISLLLAFSMALTFLPVGAVSAFAAETFEIDGVTYTVTGDNTVSVTGYDNASAAANLVLSGTVSNDGKMYTVTAIGASAFYKKSSLNSIVIPKSVITIGANAFFQDGSAYLGQGGLHEVSFEDGSELTYIKENAFAGCTNLQKIEIPEKTEYIGSFAFDSCWGLSEVTFQSGTAPLELDDGVFGNTSSLKSIEFPERLVSVGKWLFGSTVATPALTTIRLPESITKIPEGMFQGCTHLETVELTGNVTEIDKNAFNNCTALKNVIYDGTLDQWNSLINSESGNIFDETNNDNFKTPETLKYLCRVTFDAGGLGTAPETQLVYVNEPLKPFQNPVAAGYAFTGWQDENGNSFDVSTPVTKDMTLTAQWTDSPEPDVPTIDASPVDPAISTAVTVIGGVLLVGGLHELGTELWLIHHLPEGTAIPETRIELAELLWKDAGQPAPDIEAIYADIDTDDTDAQKAAQWAIENELMTLRHSDQPDRFDPNVPVSTVKVIRAWKKAQQMKTSAQ